MCLINPVIIIQIYYLRVHKVRKGQGAHQAYQELRSVPSETKVYIYRKETTNRYTLIELCLCFNSACLIIRPLMSFGCCRAVWVTQDLKEKKA